LWTFSVSFFCLFDMYPSYLFDLLSLTWQKMHRIFCGVFRPPFYDLCCLLKTRSNPYLVSFTDKPACMDGQRVKYAASIGSSVTLTCNVAANPNNVTMHWKKYGTFVKSNAVGVTARDNKYLAYSQYTIIPRLVKEIPPHVSL